MKRIGLSLATALVCAAAAPQQAVAQASSQAAVPPGGCVSCFINGNTYECKAGSPGGTSCTLSNGGQSCSVSGPCTATREPAPIDAVANLAAPALLQDAGAESAFALVSNTGDGQQVRAKCNGVVLARAYTVAAAQRLRQQTAVIEL